MIAALLTGLALVLILGISFVISALPTPAALGQRLGFAKKTSPLALTTTTTLTIPTSDEAEALTQTEVSEQNNRQIMDYLMDPRQPLVNFCGSLINAIHSQGGPYPADEFARQLVQNATSKEQDPFIESMMPLLRYVLRLSEVDQLISQVKSATERGDEGFLQKAEFYSQLVRAQAQMQQESPKIENVLDQGYLFYMLAKAVSIRPDLASDPNVSRYCEELQSEMNANPTQSFESLRESFDDFLQANQIEPSSIDYNPLYKTELSVDFGAGGIKLSGGWIDSLIAAPK